MSRRRAGHGWTGIHIAGRRIDLIGTVSGHWITSGEAVGWPRCARCRVPFEIAGRTERPDVCELCLYHHIIPREEFWSRKNDYWFPYNIGHRAMFGGGDDPLCEIQHAGATASWHRILRNHTTPSPK